MASEDQRASLFKYTTVVHMLIDGLSLRHYATTVVFSRPY